MSEERIIEEQLDWPCLKGILETKWGLPFSLDKSKTLWAALIAWYDKEDGSISSLKKIIREACLHRETEVVDYLNPCSSAACRLNGPPGATYHLGCGSQYKEYCEDCGQLLYDSAQDEIDSAEWEDVPYICQQCKADGIQPGHTYCGTTFRVPA